MSDAIALYIHFPFCLSKCGYCAFASFDKQRDRAEAYLGAAAHELQSCGSQFRFNSVYFGGGTPSLLKPGQISEILGRVEKHSGIEAGAEITMEVNPATADFDWFRDVRECGVNRISIGGQSFVDSELKMLGRQHDTMQAESTYNACRQAGFDNINIDLLYGLPGQTVHAWQYSLERVVDLAPDHISLYCLSLESGTGITRRVESGQLVRPDPDCCADQYELAQDTLEQNQYRQYEISNWAIPGKQCRHNMVYWKHEPYLGVGLSACSCIGSHRWANTSDLDEYIRAFSGGGGVTYQDDEELSSSTVVAETLILGLRLNSGINLTHILKGAEEGFAKSSRARLDEMAAYGMIDINGERVSLTRKGRGLANEVFWRLLPDKIA